MTNEAPRTGGQGELQMPAGSGIESNRPGLRVQGNPTKSNQIQLNPNKKSWSSGVLESCGGWGLGSSLSRHPGLNQGYSR